MESPSSLHPIFECLLKAIWIASNCLSFGGTMAAFLLINKRIASPIGGSVLRIMQIIPVGRQLGEKIVRAAGGMQEARTSSGAITGFLICFFTLFAKNIPLNKEDARRIIAQNDISVILFGSLEGITAVAMIAGVVKILRLD